MFPGSIDEVFQASCPGMVPRATDDAETAAAAVAAPVNRTGVHMADTTVADDVHTGAAAGTADAGADPTCDTARHFQYERDRPSAPGTKSTALRAQGDLS